MDLNKKILLSLNLKKQRKIKKDKKKTTIYIVVVGVIAFLINNLVDKKK